MKFEEARTIAERNKADGDVWQMGSAKIPEFILAEYARDHGLPVE